MTFPLNSRVGAGHRALSLRPLACGVLLVLASLTPLPSMARELNGENETINTGDPVETWRLSNGARLEVQSAGTLGIVATDSTIRLNYATVARNGANDWHSVELLGSSGLTADDSVIKDGGLLIRDTAFASMRDSSIILDETAPGFERLSTIGVNMLGYARDDAPRLDLMGSLIQVEDSPGKDHFNSGIGVNLGAGTVTLRRKTKIDAANVGVMMRGLMDHSRPLELVLDNAHVHARRSAGVQVAPGATANNEHVITLSNRSTLKGGDSLALHVGGLPGSTSTGETTVRLSVDDSIVAGDIIFDRSTVTGTVNVSLYNNAQLVGRMQDVSWAAVGSGALWYLMGDSTVDHLQVSGGGSVLLSHYDGFHTLSVDSFEGRQGELVFRTVLSDDTSQTDRLIIHGDATGEAFVRVVNAGGQGAQTQDGIELIRIGGASEADFTLSGRAVGGQYEYFLVKDANGSWYLRSQRPEPPHECVENPHLPQCEVTLPVEPGDPIDPTDPTDPEDPTDPIDPPDPIDPTDPTDPADPDRPTPILRPETGAYLANHAAMGQLLQHRARERMIAAEAVDGARTWATTGHSEQRMYAAGEQHLRSRLQRLQLGADIGALNQGHGRLGVLLTAGRADSTSRSGVTGYRAHGRVEGGAAGIYASWVRDALYLDASVQHGRFRNRVAGEGIAQEGYTAGVWQGAFEAGYRFSAGHIGGMAVNLQPQVQVTHTSTAMDAHVEQNGTVVEQASRQGLATRLGVRLEGDLGTARTHLKPYVEVHGQHDARDTALSFDGDTVQGGTPRSRVMFTAGSQAQFGSGLAAWGEVQASRGSNAFREIGARVGMSYRW